MKAAIDYKWPIVRKYTIICLFIPFMLQLCTFIAFSNVYDGQIVTPSLQANQGNMALIVILYVLAIYFFTSEVLQIMK